MTPEEKYRRTFDPHAEDALNLALEIRKFEIELYWKRATYFWAFLAVILGAYLALLTAKDLPCDQRGEILLTISCLGLVFSVAWYFVNRASKFWQENWEGHVDLLEDSINGPLYKTIVRREGLSFFSLNGPYTFSVSKINQLLSLFIVVLFFLLAARVSILYHLIGCPLVQYGNLVACLTGVAIAALWGFGRTGPFDKEKRVHIENRRTTLV